MEFVEPKDLEAQLAFQVWSETLATGEQLDLQEDL
jgi:hypothetical protein